MDVVAVQDCAAVLSLAVEASRRDAKRRAARGGRRAAGGGRQELMTQTAARE
jgi:hypothetical protein